MQENVTWLRKLHKIKDASGYEYEPVWINTRDAEARGIKHGDIVMAFSEKGKVLAGAYVTERITKHAEIQESGNPPDCTEEEMWMKNKARTPNFCLDYCGGADFCDQFKAWKKENNYTEEVI